MSLILNYSLNFSTGQPGSVLWWHTEDDFQMCIVGTEVHIQQDTISVRSAGFQQLATSLQFPQRHRAHAPWYQIGDLWPYKKRKPIFQLSRLPVAVMMNLQGLLPWNFIVCLSSLSLVR